MHRMVENKDLKYSDLLQSDSRPIVSVTDNTPHIVWTDRYKFVILELMSDGTLLLFTTNEAVIKVLPSEYQKPDFDFRDYLFDEHLVRLDPRITHPKICPRDYDLGGLPGMKRHQVPLDVIEEFDMSIYRLTHPKPPVKLIKRAPDDDRRTTFEQDFIFYNFEMPNMDFYDCWYHSSNTWMVNKAEKFYSVCPDIHLKSHPEDDTFPSDFITVTCPAPHICGLNRHLYYDLEDVSQLKFMCPDKDIEWGLPQGTKMAQVKTPIGPKCKVYFTYQASPWGQQYSLNEMYEFLLDIVSFRNKIWNITFYRCRLDHDNKQSRFWTDRPLPARLLEVREQPEPAKFEAHLRQLSQAQLFSKVRTRNPYTWNTDQGLRLLDTFIKTTPDDPKHLDLSLLPTLPYKWVDDMDARGRGFQFYYKFHDFIIYRNVIAANLYCIGNLTTNVYFDVLHNGTKITNVWKRYRPPIRTVLYDSQCDKRPLLKIIDRNRRRHEVVPWTDVLVRQNNTQQADSRLDDPMDWTPVIMPCHHSECKPPKNIYEFSTKNHFQLFDNSKGVKKLYTVTCDHLDNLIKHETNHKCTKNPENCWKIAKDGPIPFLICSGLLDEGNRVDMYKYQKHVLGFAEYRQANSFITYAPNASITTFTKAQVRTEDDPVILPKVGDNEPDVMTVPLWTCSPGCIPPDRLQEIKVAYSAEYKHWLAQLSLNADKMKYQHSTSAGHKCSLNPNAEWHLYHSEGFCAYFCTNYSLIGLNYHLPIYHPKRWTLAYQFTAHELNTLTWQKCDGYFLASLPGAQVTRQTITSPYYRVTRYPSGEFCDYSLLRFGVGMPVPHQITAPELVIYDDVHEADVLVVTKLLAKFRFTQHVAPTPADYAVRCLHGNQQQQEESYENTLRHCFGQDPQPKTDDFTVCENQLVDLLGSGLVLNTPPKTPTETEPPVLGATALPLDRNSSESEKGIARFFKKNKKQN